MDFDKIKSAIQRNLPFLCERSDNLRTLLDFLFAGGLLRQNEVEDIGNRTSNLDRFRELYHLMMKRLSNEKQWETFLQALHRSGNDMIVMRLKSTDEIPMNQEEQNQLKRKALSFKDTLLKDVGFKKMRFNIQDPITSFTGRVEFLKELHENIKKAKEHGEILMLSQTLVVNGLGGIGKTQTVRKYIHQYQQCYDHIIFIDAENHASADNQFKSLARKYLDIFLDDYDKNPTEFNLIVQQLYEKFCENSCSLLIIFDNAEALDNRIEEGLKIDGIRRYLPKSLCALDSLENPSILVTTRNLDWQISRVLQLGLWSPEEAVEFIMKVLKLADNDVNRENALKLAKLLEFYPLPLQTATTVILEQAKRFKRKTNSSYGISDLILDYESGKQEVLSNAKFERLDDFKMNMMTLWKVMMSKIKKREYGKIAQKIIKACAYLSDSKISKKVLLALFENEDTYDDGLELLIDYVLLEDREDHFVVHRVVQDVNIAHFKLKLSGSKDIIALELMSAIKSIVNNTQESQTPGQLDGYVMANVNYFLNYVSDNLEHTEYFEFTDFYANEYVGMWNFNYYKELYNFATKHEFDRSRTEKYATRLQLKAEAFQFFHHVLNLSVKSLVPNFVVRNFQELTKGLMQMLSSIFDHMLSLRLTPYEGSNQMLKLIKIFILKLQNSVQREELYTISDIMENEQILFNESFKPGSCESKQLPTECGDVDVILNNCLLSLCAEGLCLEAVFGPAPQINRPGLLRSVVKVWIDEIHFLFSSAVFLVNSFESTLLDDPEFVFHHSLFTSSHLKRFKNIFQFVYERVVLFKMKPEQQQDTDIYTLHRYGKVVLEHMGFSYKLVKDLYKVMLERLEPLVGPEHEYVVKCRDRIQFISELTEGEPANLNNLNEIVNVFLKE